MTALTQQEAALYDRQLRLWGVAAQQRIRQTKLLLYGLTAVQSEVCKNLVLAGISHVTIADEELCSVNDLSAHLFLDENSIGKNRAEASIEKIKSLNPHVQVEVVTAPLKQINIKAYDVCCVSGLILRPELLEEVNQDVRSHTLFIAVDSFGLLGIMFEDLGNNFVYEKKTNEEVNQHTILSVPYTQTLTSPINHNSEPLFVFLKVLSFFIKEKKKLLPPFLIQKNSLL